MLGHLSSLCQRVVPVDARSLPEQNMMIDPWAWSRGTWQPQTEVTLPLDDLGVLQGVMAVERLRTIDGKALDVPEHLARWRDSGQALDIQLPENLDAERLIGECVERNRPVFGGQDFSIVLLATPGSATQAAGPTLVIHPARIDWVTIVDWYVNGQQLATAKNRNVPGICWSPTVKTRCRLHYYLADRDARTSLGPTAAGVLFDIEDHVTEAAHANVIFLEGDDNVLVAPPAGSVLEGISMSRTLRLGREMGLQVVREPISPQRARAARALLLTGSTACLWSARRLDEHEYPNAADLDVVCKLQDRWKTEIGYDYIKAARQWAR